MNNMDTDDDQSSPDIYSAQPNVMTTTVAPNQFLLSTYKENIRANIDNDIDDHLAAVSMSILGNIKLSTSSSYKCCLCRKIVDDATLTCAKCVNTGRFCPLKHDNCSNKRRQALANMLNSSDFEEFQQYSNKYSINSPPHLQCSDRMFFLKKFNIEKKNLQAEYQTKMEPVFQLHQMSEEILIRKNRLNHVNKSIERLREQIKKGQKANDKIRERMGTQNQRIKFISKKDRKRIDHEKKLHIIRRQRLNEVYKYIFPIEHLSSIEEDLASTLRALSSAQQPIADEANNNNDWSENDDILAAGGGRYQIVNSCLPANGDYQIAKLLSTLDVNNKSPDMDSFQTTLTHELYEALSALSHACQLINVIAFYLHIALPFRLHQLEFNGDNLTTDRLRADIAKLNANIVTSCLAQDIPIENTHVTYTMENLLKLLTFKEYRSRPKPVLYLQSYIDMMEEEVNEISRAYVTDYWFDDVEKDVMDILTGDEWETISHDYNIPDDPSIHERMSSSPSISIPHPHSTMNGSIGYLKTISSSVFNSFFNYTGK
ncbi:unnamed protein product [Rotaria socialis]|uniref:Beclin 1-associated autophagy-related key regulator n=1 Tax=Rotaria socialis TaxID=392032 RepID=A0A820Q505_9BILA|nr:unnamed protein product [Rotaria socialis]